MTEALTRTRITAMFGEINGVKTAFPQIPRRLQDAQLPAVVVFPGRATHDRHSLSESMILETRIYKAVLYVANAGFGTSGDTEIQADPLFDAVLQHFAARPGLELSSEGTNQTYAVLNAELQSDGGLQVGPYPIGNSAGQPPTDYIQIQWDIQVQEVVQIINKD